MRNTEKEREPGTHGYSNRDLFDKQIDMLRTFLEKGAITEAQYEKSSGDLSRLTGYTPTDTFRKKNGGKSNG